MFYTIFYLFIIKTSSLIILPKINNKKFINTKNSIITLLNNDKLLINNCNLNYEYRIKNINKVFYKILKKNKIPFDIYGFRIIYDNTYYNTYYNTNYNTYYNTYYNTNYNTNNNTIYYAYYIKKLIKNNYITIDNYYDDYIKNPKKNNYQSLHLYIHNEIIIEIQIRNQYMHYIAINGSASNYF